MLTGRLPFGAQVAKAVLVQHKKSLTLSKRSSHDEKENDFRPG